MVLLFLEKDNVLFKNFPNLVLEDCELLLSLLRLFCTVAVPHEQDVNVVHLLLSVLSWVQSAFS